MKNLFLPVVVWVQITTISASLVLTEAIHINNRGGDLAIIYTMLAVVIFILPFLWSGKIHCSGIKTSYRKSRKLR